MMVTPFLTAQEMFEKLGYEKQQETDYSGWIRYVQSFDESDKCCIEFSMTYGAILALYIDGNTPLPLNTEDLKAIVQQCKELGWLE